MPARGTNENVPAVGKHAHPTKLGGGVMDEHFDLYEAPLNEMLEKMTLFPHHPVRVARAELGNDAGMIGAAFLAMKACDTST